MSMRRRRPPSPPIEAKLAPPIPSVLSPKGRPYLPAAPRRTKLSPTLRFVLFALPLLAIGFYLISQALRNNHQLGTEYAVCTRSRDGIIRMSEGTATGEPSRTQCIVVQSGKIADTGSIEHVRMAWGDRETRGNGGIEIRWLRKGQTVLPGLIDAHAHVLQYGESQTSVDLVGATSVSEIRDRIAAFIEATPGLKSDKAKFILGLGWDQTKFTDTDGEFPTAADLEKDPRLVGRPIYLKRIDVHALWVSPKILSLLPPALPDDVPGGKIVRLPSSQPSGVFLDNAMGLVTAVIPPWSDTDRLQFLRATSRSMLKYGMTAVMDASLSLRDIAFLKSLDKEGKLPVRIMGMLSCENPLNRFCGNDLGSEMYMGDRFQMRSVKLFVDGALGSWGAAMHEPYSDNPDTNGILICEKEELNRVVEQWVSRGYQVNSHGIGDRANTLILEAYERVLSNASLPSSPLHPSNSRSHSSSSTSLDAAAWAEKNPLRLRIEHAQILRVEDIGWMGDMGVVASFQPTHATSDMGYVEKRIGPERVRGAYAWRKIVASNAPWCLGSDFPVEHPDPFLGLYASVTRKDRNPALGSPSGRDVGWYEQERLLPYEALQGFTVHAARAGFMDDRIGKLDKGYEADFVVVDDGDVLTLGSAAEHETPDARLEREKRLVSIGERVVATVVGGRVLYGKL
ncbi:hypothetical protein JCM10212_002816 [Sporobolomyces blumeae]